MRFLTVLLVGWGLGWLVARSVLLAGAREAVAQWRDRVLQAVDEDYLAVGSVPAIRGVFWRGWLRAALPRFVFGVVHCAACSGFWIGCALGVSTPLVGTGLLGALVTGVIVMGVNAALDGITGAASAIEQAAWGVHDATQSMADGAPAAFAALDKWLAAQAGDPDRLN